VQVSYIQGGDQKNFQFKPHTLNIFIIGSGNMAYQLTSAFRKHDIAIMGIYARNNKTGRQIAQLAGCQRYESLKSIPKDADLYLICVSDDAISSIVEQLPKNIKKSKTVAHTSGSKSIAETLDSCKNAGVFYPLQTFSRRRKVSFKKIPFCITGNNKKTIKKLSELASILSDNVHEIEDSKREWIHLSAVLINNFVNHLIYLSEGLLSKKDLDPAILQPLLMETIRKQKSLGAYEAQTGPARRMDSQTLAKHLDLMKREKNIKSVYTTLSRSIQKTYKDKT